MSFVIDAIICGPRRFNDSVEGQHHDFTKVRVLMPVPADSKNEIGFNQVELPFGDHKNFENFERYKGKFPFMAKVTLEPTSKGFNFIGFEPVVSSANKAAA